jgi:hypothetical protein
MRFGAVRVRFGTPIGRCSHRALLKRMTAEIRRRKYSIRTEQAYECWVGPYQREST